MDKRITDNYCYPLPNGLKWCGQAITYYDTTSFIDPNDLKEKKLVMNNHIMQGLWFLIDKTSDTIGYASFENDSLINIDIPENIQIENTPFPPRDTVSMEIKW